MAEDKEKSEVFGPQVYGFGTKESDEEFIKNGDYSDSETTPRTAPDLNVTSGADAGAIVGKPGKTPEGISPSSSETMKRIEATTGTDRQIRTLQEWMDSEENRPETPEEREKRERKERSKRIIAAVGDGLSALGNLYFTSQYAPNMYNHEKGSMTKAVNDRIERMKAERENKRNQYMNFAMKIGDLENQRAATLRELEEQQERRKLAREKAQREAEQHGWLAALQPDKRREQAGKASKAEMEAITAQAEAEAAPEMQAAKLATERARKGSYVASAANSYASANAHNRSNPYEYTAWDEYDNPHQFKEKKSADVYAKQHGTWKEEDIVETFESENEISTKTKKGGHAGKPSPTGKKSPTA